jgi:hypothetical protein
MGVTAGSGNERGVIAMWTGQKSSNRSVNLIHFIFFYIWYPNSEIIF